MKYTCIFIVFIFSNYLGVAQNITLKTGDLLFQDIDCGDMCDAIEAVTQGYHDKKFSHIGLVTSSNDSIYVIESVGEGVRQVTFDAFKKRSTKPLLVARVKKIYETLIPDAIAFAQKQIGTPYDDAFLYDNGKYYCSELIYDAFKKANNDQPFFALEPMTFKQPDSQDFFPVWKKYYNDLNMPIPEGKPGCNPGGISRSKKIIIVGEL